MSPKLTSEYKGYSFFTFSNEGSEPVHVHVCRGGNVQFSDKFWLTDGGWVVVEPIKVVSKGDLRKVLGFLVANTESIRNGYLRHHSAKHPEIKRLTLN